MILLMLIIENYSKITVRDFGNVCIDLREEWLYGKKLKTDDYEKKCAEENGTLLTIRNLQEHEYVKKMLMKSYTTGYFIFRKFILFYNKIILIEFNIK